MSRGPGCLQRYLFNTLRRGDHAMTFTEIIAIAKPHESGYRPHVERSLRRALKRMIDDGVVFTAGRGGPGDPQRYFLHPLLGGAVGGVE